MRTTGWLAAGWLAAGRLAAVVMVGALASAQPASAQASGPEYSADASMETSGGVMSGPAYFAPGKERREYDMDGAKMINITRRDKKVVWSLMPEDGMYTEMAMPASGGDESVAGYTFEHTRVGPETMNGMQTNKSKIIMTAPNGDKLGGFMWATNDGIVVKIDAIAADKSSKERFKMELKNIQIGPQDKSLFEVPSNYVKMDMGGIGGIQNSRE